MKEVSWRPLLPTVRQKPGQSPSARSATTTCAGHSDKDGEDFRDLRGDLVFAGLIYTLIQGPVQRAVHGERRARIAVYLAGIFSILFLPIVGQYGQLAGWSEITVFVWQVGSIVLIPLVFALSLLIGGFARTGQLDELGAWLGSTDGTGSSLRAALARTLGDDSVQLLFGGRGGRGYVDEVAGRSTGPRSIRPPEPFPCRSGVSRSG